MRFFAVLVVVVAGSLGCRSEGHGKVWRSEILKIEYLGEAPRDYMVSWGRYDAAVFYVEYTGQVGGGNVYGAKVFVPKGDPPTDGWPVKIWLHGFGGPGFDFWIWPSDPNADWRVRGYGQSIGFACHGFLCVAPWHTGAGPSTPFATYSPFTLPQQAATAWATWSMIESLEDALRRRPTLLTIAGLSPHQVKIDTTREVMSTNCISTPTLIYWAANWRKYPQCRHVRVMLADTFLPNPAHLLYYLYPLVYQMDPQDAILSVSLWAGPVWCKADVEGIPMTEFFRDKAIQFFAEPVQLPSGRSVPRMRAARLEGGTNDIAQPLYNAIKADLGHDPSAAEIVQWVFSQQIEDLLQYGLNQTGIDALLQDPVYRRLFADCDPFFQQNITPFEPGIPLIVVGNGDTSTPKPPLPSPADRFELTGLDKVKRLRNWGWDVRVYYQRGLATSSWNDTSIHTQVLQELADILYPQGVPPELQVNP